MRKTGFAIVEIIIAAAIVAILIAMLIPVYKLLTM